MRWDGQVKMPKLLGLEYSADRPGNRKVVWYTRDISGWCLLVFARHFTFFSFLLNLFLHLYLAPESTIGTLLYMY